MKKYTATDLAYYGNSELIQLILDLQEKITPEPRDLYTVEFIANGETQVITKLEPSTIQEVTKLIEQIGVK